MACSAVVLLSTTAAAAFKSVGQYSMEQLSNRLCSILSYCVFDGPARRRDAWATPSNCGYWLLHTRCCAKVSARVCARGRSMPRGAVFSDVMITTGWRDVVTPVALETSSYRSLV
eukprot:672694-Pyramimonas_sp.AAC.1